MTRVASLSGLEIDFWAKTKQDHIESHLAWHGELDLEGAKACLKGKAPFTYVLHPAGKEHSYFITFVSDNGEIKHQDFVLELDLKGWHYKNFSPRQPTETVDELIPQMMHCVPDDCKPLNC